MAVDGAGRTPREGGSTLVVRRGSHVDPDWGPSTAWAGARCALPISDDATLGLPLSMPQRSDPDSRFESSLPSFSHQSKQDSNSQTRGFRMAPEVRYRATAPTASRLKDGDRCWKVRSHHVDDLCGSGAQVQAELHNMSVAVRVSPTESALASP
jgi:hypothetical protein